MYAVILAGGGGTRLWPLSRPETPKPFLPLLGARSLLQLTLDRIVDHPELHLERGDVTVVTDRRYAQLVTEQLPGVRVVSEPAGRNTAAAVALAALAIERDPDEVMVVLPADQLVAEDREGVYRGVLADAETELARGAFDIESPLVTLGVQVTRPATEYGYLIPDLNRGQGPASDPPRNLAAYRLRSFEEKPTPSRAAELKAEPGVAWNAGIFLWRRRAIRDALERTSGLVTLIEPVLRSETGLAAAYDQLRPISIDRAVMEPAAQRGQVVMGAMDVGWSDLGGWTALVAALGGRGEGRVVAPGTPAEAGTDDLLVERVDGRLVVTPGPRAILAPTPTALLVGSAPARAEVDALIARVAAWEERS
jgi:mannose-1-phosphate guanylyltransferase